MKANLESTSRCSKVGRRDLAANISLSPLPSFPPLSPSSLSYMRMLTRPTAYQSFIDLLTNQGKTSSAAFLQLYSSLSEAPDPYPLLEASVESLVLSEETLPKLNSERELLHKNANKLASQLEETERRFQEERTARQELEAREASRIHEVETSWTKVLEEKQNNWESSKKALEEKVENQEKLLKEIKASYEVSQRLGQEAAGADDHAGRSTASAAELEILASDLEKTSARLAEMEARNEQLRLELAQAVSHTTSEKATRPIEEEPLFLRMQSENSSLLRKLDSARLDKEAEKRSWESRLRQVERHKLQLDAENQELRSKVQKWADYDEIRRELEMIKFIEFSTGDDDDTERERPHMNGSADAGKKESLEQLLLARNKKLSEELTVLRVSHRSLQQQLETLQEDLSKTNAALEKSQNLSSTLENDLLRVQEEAAHTLPSSGASVAGTYTPRLSQPRRGRASPTSSIISGFDNQSRPQPATLEALRSGEPVGGGSGILPMIQAQRDRFKQKNSQLEEELSKTYATVASLRQEVASLQKDNLSLYEKSRYISTYSRGQPSTTSSSSAYSQGPSHTSIQMGPDASDRYRSQYEANISPFAAFRGREAARAYKRMSLPERIIFSITRMVLATRTSRNLFAGYCLALHLMIFLMLYWTGTTEVEKHASNLGNAAIIAAGGVGSQAQQDSGHAEWHQEGFPDG
jgi:homeobox protein cut-like